MGRKEFDSNQNFEDIWGEDVQNSSGFTMVPNDLLQNLGALNLTPAQKIVLIEIISLGSYGISAQRMGERTGLSADTVRDAWRQLDGMGIAVRERYSLYDVNHFDISGLITIVEGYARNHLESMGKTPSPPLPYYMRDV